MWNIIKVNNKNSKKINNRSGVSIVNFEDISHLFTSVSIVDFEQVNVSWEILSLESDKTFAVTEMISNWLKISQMENTVKKCRSTYLPVVSGLKQIRNKYWLEFNPDKN